MVGARSAVIERGGSGSRASQLIAGVGPTVGWKMEADDRTHKLLEEIRDAQREHLAEYRRVTQELLNLQQRAMERQQMVGQLYRRIVVVGGALVATLLVLLVYLLVRWSHYLFR